MTADWVVAELYKIAAANMADYMRSTPQGDPYLDFSALSRDQTTALSEVTVDDYVDARGEDAREVKRVKFKLHDKLLRARRSLRPLHPERLGQDRLAAYRDHGADRIVAEINNGGEMVEATLRVIDENVAYTGVHASRGKGRARRAGRRTLRARGRPHPPHGGLPAARGSDVRVHA